MNRLLTILLLLGATAHGQIDNPPSSVNIVDSTATGRAVLTATNAAAAANAIGLGTTNDATFNRVVTTANGTFTNPALRIGASNTGLVSVAGVLYGVSRGEGVFLASPTSFTVVPPATFLTNVTINGNANLDGAATFSTNVTVNGNLSVGSLTTTTPSTWALDATQTAADTNGILALPSNANVIRLTNSTAISGVSGGVLGAFYYLVNQTTNAVTISNVGGITVQGGTPLTLGAGQAATLVATGATNASVAARGDLNNVTLTGVDNLATQQTASSGASLMTRELSDTRYGEWISQTEMGQLEFTTATTTQTTLGGSYQSPNTNILSGAAVRMYGFTNSGDYNVLNVVASSLMWLSSGGVAQQGSGIGLFVRANASIGTNRVARIVYGGVSSNQVAGIVGTNGLDRRGFALEIAPITSATNNLRLIAQDGTNGIVASAWIPVASGAGLTGATYFMAHSNGTTRVYYGTDNARPSRTPVVTLNHVFAAGLAPAQPAGILFSVVNTNSDTAAGNLFIRAAWQMINADLVGY